MWSAWLPNQSARKGYKRGEEEEHEWRIEEDRSGVYVV